MIRIAIILLIFVAGLKRRPVFGIRYDSGNPDLIVSDATGNLSNEQLKRLADQAQETLNKIIAFWSADPDFFRVLAYTSNWMYNKTNEIHH